jgi:hypothetical protein
MTGSPCATLFITVLFLPQLTENHQFQRVIKDQADPGEAEAALSSIALSCMIPVRIPQLISQVLCFLARQIFVPRKKGTSV